MNNKINNIRRKIKIRRTEISYIVICSPQMPNCDESQVLNYFYKNLKNVFSHYIIGENRVIELTNPSYYTCRSMYNKGAVNDENSIIINICDKKENPIRWRYSSDKDWYITESIKNNLCDTICNLMNQHHIELNNVLRKYDVTSSYSPPSLMNGEWDEIKNIIASCHS